MSCLLLHRVTKRFDGVLAVKGVSLEFREGQIAALIGANGAGKTTIFNLISGQLGPTEGRILVDDVEISNKPSWQIAKIGVGRMFQEARVFPRISVKHNVMVAFPEQTGENPLRTIFSRSATRQQLAFEEKADELLQLVRLQDHSERPAQELSYGQQKLLAIARLLAAGSQILLLDEPTAGVTPRTAEEILSLLRKMANDGKTIVMIEHNINIINDWVDVVHFMDGGRVRLSGHPGDILQESEVKTAYLGVAR